MEITLDTHTSDSPNFSATSRKFLDSEWLLPLKEFSCNKMGCSSLIWRRWWGEMENTNFEFQTLSFKVPLSPETGRTSDALPEWVQNCQLLDDHCVHSCLARSPHWRPVGLRTSWYASVRTPHLVFLFWLFWAAKEIAAAGCTSRLSAK